MSLEHLLNCFHSAIIGKLSSDTCIGYNPRVFFQCNSWWMRTMHRVCWWNQNPLKYNLPELGGFAWSGLHWIIYDNYNYNYLYHLIFWFGKVAECEQGQSSSYMMLPTSYDRQTESTAISSLHHHEMMVLHCLPPLLPPPHTCHINDDSQNRKSVNMYIYGERIWMPGRFTESSGGKKWHCRTNLRVIIYTCFAYFC